MENINITQLIVLVLTVILILGQKVATAWGYMVKVEHTKHQRLRFALIAAVFPLAAGIASKIAPLLS